MAAALVLLLGAGACAGDEQDALQPGGDRTGERRGPEHGGDASAASPSIPAGHEVVEPTAPPLAERFVPAGTAGELARRLTRAHGLVSDPGTRGDLLAAAAFETQLLYRQLARTPEWQGEVFFRMRGLRPVAELHVEARRSLRSVLTTLTDQLPAWAVVEPPPVHELIRYYREGERVHGVEWEVLAAINLVETGFGKIDGLSSAGAQGPMQFIPSTWAAYGDGDVEDPHDAILGAANYLAASGAASGDVQGALYAYNNHPGYVAGISAYAEILRRDPAALRGLHAWQIIYLSTIGDIWLPVGYRETEPVPVRTYVRQHPEHHLGPATS